MAYLKRKILMANMKSKPAKFKIGDTVVIVTNTYKNCRGKIGTVGRVEREMEINDKLIRYYGVILNDYNRNVPMANLREQEIEKYSNPFEFWE